MEELYVSKIAELREKVGLTQKELADSVGIDISTLRNWERNRSGTETFARIDRLCATLQCKPGDLYAIEDIAIDSDNA